MFIFSSDAKNILPDFWTISEIRKVGLSYRSANRNFRPQPWSCNVDSRLIRQKN